jgi:hypothetical protein
MFSGKAVFTPALLPGRGRRSSVRPPPFREVLLPIGKFAFSTSTQVDGTRVADICRAICAHRPERRQHGNLAVSKHLTATRRSDTALRQV